MTNGCKPWHHSPSHVFEPNVTYIVTAATRRKAPIFRNRQRLQLLERTFFEICDDYHWAPQAWAFFPNHYHFIAYASLSGRPLKQLVQRLHSQTARLVNRLDQTPRRRVWFQYWDTALTYEKSYYARLNYVHNNPVKHGLVPVADQYPFCSAAWFHARANPAFRRKVESFGYDRLEIEDDF